MSLEDKDEVLIHAKSEVLRMLLYVASVYKDPDSHKHSEVLWGCEILLCTCVYIILVHLLFYQWSMYQDFLNTKTRPSSFHQIIVMEDFGFGSSGVGSMFCQPYK